MLDVLQRPVAFVTPYDECMVAEGTRARLVGWRPLGPVVHFCYHKAGTVWFQRVLRRFAEEAATPFIVLRRERNALHGAPPGLYFDGHSAVSVPDTPDLRGSHMVRDPRDIVVSGYHYHLRASEAWLHRPQDRYGGISYQALLRRLDREQGLVEEVRRCTELFARMRSWNRRDPRILELTDEESFGNDEWLWTRVGNHIGVAGDDLARLVEIGKWHAYGATVERNRRKGERSVHLRKGSSGQWREEFTPPVRDEFNRVAGDLLTHLGYDGD